MSGSVKHSKLQQVSEDPLFPVGLGGMSPVGATTPTQVLLHLAHSPLCVVAGSDHLGLPAKPAVVSMAGIPNESSIIQQSIDTLRPDSAINDEIVNFVLGLLQLEAYSMAGKERWSMLTSFFKSNLLEK